MKKYKMAKVIFKLFGNYAIMKYIDMTPKENTQQFKNWQETEYF